MALKCCHSSIREAEAPLCVRAPVVCLQYGSEVFVHDGGGDGGGVTSSSREGTTSKLGVAVTTWAGLC